MLRTFNCGVGFCLFIKKNNYKKVRKYFTKKFLPYEIGFISKDKNRLKLYNKLKWLK